MSTPATALLTARTYTIPEAARLAHTSSANVRRWLFGDERPGHGMEPVLGKERKLDSRISFLDLAEIIVVASFRRKGGKGIPIDRFRILETPNEFALIEPNNVKIVFIENGHSTAWRVFQVIQNRWSWLADQWSGTGPLVWILALSGRAEPFRLEDGVRRSSRERRLGRATRDASGGPGRPEA